MSEQARLVMNRGTLRRFTDEEEGDVFGHFVRNATAYTATLAIAAVVLSLAALGVAIPALVIGGGTGSAGAAGAAGATGVNGTSGGPLTWLALYNDTVQTFAGSSNGLQVTRFFDAGTAYALPGSDTSLVVGTNLAGQTGVYCNAASSCGTYAIDATTAVRATSVPIGTTSTATVAIVIASYPGTVLFGLASTVVGKNENSTVAAIGLSTVARLDAGEWIQLVLATTDASGWVTDIGKYTLSHSMSFARLG